MEWSKSHDFLSDLAISPETERRSEGEKEREGGVKIMGVIYENHYYSDPTIHAVDLLF